MERIRLGVIGCGDVAWSVYLPGLAELEDRFEVVAVSARRRERAERAAAHFKVPRAYGNYEEMFAGEDLDAVLNLTPIPVHTEVNLACLDAGCHLYTEKPLASDVDSGRRVLAAAGRARRKVATAPPMVLTPDYRMLAKIVSKGHIGKVCWVRAHASHQGVARFWNFRSDPTSYYQPGSGPLFDLAIYPLHGLTAILGPVRRVTAMSAKRLPKLEVQSGPARGEEIVVQVDDVSLLTLEFQSGVLGTVDGTFCVHADNDDPTLEVYGETGTAQMGSWYPWGGLKVFRRDAEAQIEGWMRPGHVFPGLLDEEYEKWRRFNMAAGLEDFAGALQEGREPVAGGEHALHVVEVIEKAYEAAKTGRTQDLETTFPSPVERMIKDL